MIWQLKTFEQLTNIELYEILKLRSEVFVVEQNCVFLDLDDIDKKCHHLFCTNTDNEIIAYARILPPGLHYAESSIGRVVSSAKHRGNGFGKMLMNRAIEECINLYPNYDIQIGGQLYLKTFYENLLFVQTSEIYLEDGIDHIKMIRKTNQ